MSTQERARWLTMMRASIRRSEPPAPRCEGCGRELRRLVLLTSVEVQECVPCSRFERLHG